MRATLLSLLLLGAGLAGCAGEPGLTADTGVQVDGLEAEVSSTLGGIRGVVVDTAIRPVAKVTVSLTGGDANRTTQTDAAGQFVFDLVAPGAYFLRATHTLYQDAQASVEVAAGIEPPVTKLQVTPKFTAKPYTTQVKFQGFIQCGYQAPVVTAPCVTDYTTIVCAGGCVPPLHEPLKNAQGDHRYLNTSIEADWQTLVLEMTWEPNGQGTTDDMGMLLSYTKRDASHWFGNVEGPNPLLLRFEVGEEHGSAQPGDRPLVNATGDSDLMILGSVKMEEGSYLGVGISQNFEVIQTNFYNAKPDEGWSFVAGNPLPF